MPSRSAAPCPTLRRDGQQVLILDQTRLPHGEHYVALSTLEDAAHAIRSMQVRGAPLIGATAAYGIALALKGASGDTQLAAADLCLRATRPTAVNLHWALDRMQQVLAPLTPEARPAAAWAEADAIRTEDAAANQAIGAHGLAAFAPLIAARQGAPLQLMTHCNAGWLATCGHGTALAPIYAAHAAGVPVHVWVSETRPRNQGLLTAWELNQAGIPHTLIADNAAGWLMAEGRVDAVIVGADRIAANGDAANKVGTYLKGLAAQAHGLPFYVAAPWSTVDLICPSGRQIPIEERSGDEFRLIPGLDANGQLSHCRILPEAQQVCNPAFDVTPAGLIRAIITETGAHAPGQLAALHPARNSAHDSAHDSARLS